MTEDREGVPGGTGDSQQGSGRPDDSRTEHVDLTQFEDFRRYDANRQRREAALSNENQQLKDQRDELLRELRLTQAASGAFQEVLSTAPNEFELAGRLAGEAQLKAENEILREQVSQYQQATQAQQTAQQWVAHYTSVCRESGVDPNDRAVQAGIIQAAYNEDHAAFWRAFRAYQPPGQMPGSYPAPAQPELPRRPSEPTPPSGGGRTAAHSDVEQQRLQAEYDAAMRDMKRRRAPAEDRARLRQSFQQRGLDI